MLCIFWLRKWSLTPHTILLFWPWIFWSHDHTSFIVVRKQYGGWFVDNFWILWNTKHLLLLSFWLSFWNAYCKLTNEMFSKDEMYQICNRIYAEVQFERALEWQGWKPLKGLDLLSCWQLDPEFTVAVLLEQQQPPGRQISVSLYIFVLKLV